nr:integrase, catalytic region, zinc finger, CCHC-type, peptidase aspartic, catalytic [Tanacetum cinerariifolium]
LKSHQSAADSGPIFDDEPLQKVSNDDHYNVFAMGSTHPEQSKSVYDTYPIEQDAQNVSIDSLDMSYDREEIDQNDDDNDLAKERELLASLIEKLKCEIDESKNRNKFLETSNKDLIEKLKELARRNSKEYASQMELECAKVRGCYNDNLALMLIPDSDEVIRLEKESRSKLSDLIRPFDYEKLNNLRISAGLNQFLKCLNKEMVADLRYFNSLESEVDSLRSQLETQKTQFLNEIDRLSREYYYADHMNAILGMYTELDELIEIVLFIVDSGCSKHMTGNLKLLINFVDKKSTCFIRDLKGNDLLTGSRGTELYSITLQSTNSPNPICLMAKATSSQAWLWHRRLSHLNFDTINLLSKNDIVVLSKEDLKCTRIEHGFKRAFMSLFGQESDTSTTFLVIKRQFQKFIDSQFTLDYDSQMTYKYFVEYTEIEVKQFRETLLQHMSNVKKFVAESTRHQRRFERRVNTRQMQTQETKIDTDKALDVDLVVTKSRQQHTEQPGIITEGRVDLYTEQCQVQSPTLDSSIDNKTIEFSNQSLEFENFCLKKTFLNGKSNEAKIKHDTDETETINIKLEHSVAKLLTKNEHLKQTYKDLYDSIIKTQVQTKVHNDSLIVKLNNKSTKNADLRAQLQEKVFAIAALKNELRKLKGNSVDTKFAKTSVLGKPVLQSLRNQTVVRQPNAFKSERPSILKLRFTSQVDVNKNLSKSVTQHYLPRSRATAFAKPDLIIASSS